MSDYAPGIGQIQTQAGVGPPVRSQLYCQYKPDIGCVAPQHARPDARAPTEDENACCPDGEKRSKVTPDTKEHEEKKTRPGTSRAD